MVRSPVLKPLLEGRVGRGGWLRANGKNWSMSLDGWQESLVQHFLRSRVKAVPVGLQSPGHGSHRAHRQLAPHGRLEPPGAHQRLYQQVNSERPRMKPILTPRGELRRGSSMPHTKRAITTAWVSVAWICAHQRHTPAQHLHPRLGAAALSLMCLFLKLVF